MVGVTSGWNGMAYLAGTKFVQVGSELRVVDVSNPQAPQQVGALLLPSNARDVAVEGNYAYVADDAIIVVDVSNPTSPSIVGSVALPAVEWVTVSSGIVYAGTYTGPYATADEIGLFVIDARSPANPTIIGHIPETKSNGPYAITGNTLLSPYRIHDVSDLTSPRVVGPPPLPLSERGNLPPLYGVEMTLDPSYAVWAGAGVFVVELQ